MKKTYLLLFSLFVVNIVNAQWQQTGGPVGCYVNCISVVGEDIYIGTNTGVFLSNNNGLSWQPINKGIENIKVISIAVDGANIFIGTDMKGLYHSINNGIDWNKVDLRFNSTSVIFFVHSLAISENKIFAGTEAGVFLSTDNGENWTSMNNGYASATSSILTLAIHNANIFAGTTDGEIYLSTNNGANWNVVLPKLPNPNNTHTYINTILISDTNIYAGTEANIYVSTNNGTSWNSLNTPSLTDTKILSLAVIGTNIFAGTNAGVFYSSDNGLNWSKVNNGLPNFAIKSLAIKDSTNIFAGTFGFFHSTNHGDDWVSRNNGLSTLSVNSLVSTDINLVAATNGGIYLSNNTIDNWHPSINNAQMLLSSVLSLAKNDKYLFTGAYYSYNMLISANDGESWVKKNNGIENVLIKSISCADSTIVAGTDNGLYLSTNNGNVWKKTSINDYIISTAISGINIVAGGYCFCGGSSGSRIYLSLDNGNSWKNITPGYLMNEVTSLAINNDKIFAGSTNSIFFSSDNGVNWISINNNIGNKTIKSIVTNGSNIFVGTADGIFQSNNNGNSWEDISLGLSNRKVLSIALNNTFAFVGTNGSSVWKRPISELITNIEPSPEYILNIYPNPVRAKLTIETTYLINESILSISNINGQELIKHQLIDTKTQIDISNLPTGIYFVKLLNDMKIEVRKVIKE